MLKSPAQLSEEARQEIPEISVADVAAQTTGGARPFLLIDVREPNEHAAGIIPGAIPLPRGLIEISIAKIVQDENAPIVCYCGGGTRSLFGAQQLKRVGFKNVKSMAGGFKGWTMAGNDIAQP
ncbi:MAG: rhodanese-like domain-containing protein [Planctomycetota bacterium]